MNLMRERETLRIQLERHETYLGFGKLSETLFCSVASLVPNQQVDSLNVFAGSHKFLNESLRKREGIFHRLASGFQISIA